MSTSTDFPDDYLAMRLADRPGLDPELTPLLDSCLREWGGVSYEEATVADMLRASRAAAAAVVKRSPSAAAAMAGRVDFTSTELLQALSSGNRS